MLCSHREMLLLTTAALLVCLFATASGPELRYRAPAIAAQDLPAVSVEQSAYNDATVYRIATSGCTITWTVYTTELNRGVVKHTSRCTLSLARQLPYLASILGTVVGQNRTADSFHTLFWGGLVPEQGPSSLEMSFRLAMAAHRSPGWDAKRGRPKHGDLNRFVKELANSEPIYPEVRALFAGKHRVAAIASMEKVRVLEAERLPFSAELKKQGVQDGERLPFDAMIWFRVTAER